MSSINLRTSDGVIMEVDEESIVSYMLNNNDYNGSFLDCFFDSRVLSKVIEYCKFHAASGVSRRERNAFDADFVNVNPSLLHQIFVAAVTFRIKSLMDLTRELTCRSVLGDQSKRSRASFDEFDSPTRTKNVNGIDCIIQKNDDVVEYTPYNGVFVRESTLVAAVGEIPEEMKLKRKNALTFSFPSLGIMFGKTEDGEEFADQSRRESKIESDKYFDEAYKKAFSAKSPSLGSSSSAMRPCASGTGSSHVIQVCMDINLRMNPRLHLILSNKIADKVKHWSG